MKIQASITVSLLSVLTFVALPALADPTDYESMMYGFLGRGKIDNHTQGVVVTNLNTRQAQLEQQISSGVASGQLTAAEQADVQNDLNSTANLQGQYLAMGGGKLNNIQIQTLVNDYTAITTKLNAYLTNATTVSSATPYHRNWFDQHHDYEGYDDHRQAEGHIDSYQAEVMASIQSALSSGKISLYTAQSLRAQLNQTDADQMRMTANGHLSHDDARTLLANIDAVKAKLNQSIANGGRWHGHWSNDVDSTRVVFGQSMLHQRITDGLNAGKLSRWEANSLFQNEQRIRSLDSQINSSSRMSWSDQKRLLAERDQLTQDVNQELTQHNVW